MSCPRRAPLVECNSHEASANNIGVDRLPAGPIACHHISTKEHAVKSNTGVIGVTVVAICLLSCAEVFANSASWTGQCYSIALSTGVTASGIAGFTTWDGTTNTPHFCTNGSYFVLSGELKPIPPGSRTYLTDYIFSTDGTYAGVIEYGSASVILTNIDSDTNGFPDVIQLNKLGNSPITGTATSDWNYYGYKMIYTLSGTLTRAAGSSTGTYSLTLTSSLVTNTMAGSIYLSHCSGMVTYTPGSSNVTMAAMVVQADGSTYNVAGTTSYIINSTNQITVAACTLSNASQSYSLNSFVLQRGGTSYRGNVNEVDGNLKTSWPDYTNWWVEVVDTNDANGNGIPDLSDPMTAWQLWQIQYFGSTTNAAAAGNADPFGKGISNTNQFLAGLNPTNPASVFRVTRVMATGSNFTVTWKTAGVRTNFVQATNGGSGGRFSNNFQDVSVPIMINTSGDTTTNYTDVGGATNRPSRFYRIRLAP
jgi:hypothetical protein